MKFEIGLVIEQIEYILESKPNHADFEYLKDLLKQLQSILDRKED